MYKNADTPKIATDLTVYRNIAVAGRISTKYHFSRDFENCLKTKIGWFYRHYGSLNVITGAYGAFERLTVRLVCELKAELHTGLKLTVVLTKAEYSSYMSFKSGSGHTDRRGRWRYMDGADEIVQIKAEMPSINYDKRNIYMLDRVCGLITVHSGYDNLDVVARHLMYYAEQKKIEITNLAENI